MILLLIVGIVLMILGIAIWKFKKANNTLSYVLFAVGGAILLSLLEVILMPTTANAQEIQDTWICEEYQEYIYEISDEYCISPELVMAIVEHESSGKANVRNGNCKGLMQVYEKFHRDRMKRLGVTNLYDPYSNILVGVDYIMELAAEYDDLPLVLMIYNGSSDAKVRNRNNNYTSYAKSVMARAEELTDLHYEEPPAPIVFPDEIPTLKNLLRWHTERECKYEIKTTLQEG